MLLQVFQFFEAFWGSLVPVDVMFRYVDIIVTDGVELDAEQRMVVGFLV